MITILLTLLLNIESNFYLANMPYCVPFMNFSLLLIAFLMSLYVLSRSRTHSYVCSGLVDIEIFHSYSPSFDWTSCRISL